MSSTGSPGANDNGNADPLLSLITNTDSNDALTAGGTLFGEVTLPSKFLSAKNSIEIHKSKVLSTNQSLPNVSGRGNCLQNLISQQQYQQQSRDQSNLRSFLCPHPGKTERTTEDCSTRRCNSGQKSSKSVNWAPLLSGHTNVPLRGQMVSPQSSTGNLRLSDINNKVGEFAPLSAPGADGPLLDDDEMNITTTFPPGGNLMPEMIPKLRPYQASDQLPVKALSESQSHVAIYADNFTSGLHGSDTSITKRQTAEGGTHVNFCGSAIDTGNCPSPTLNPTSISEYAFMNQTVDDNCYKPSCLFLPPAENYVYNAHVDLNASEELIRHREQLTTQNYTLERRDQYIGSDMTTLKTKENNLDNHNYDTDDDIGDPDPQTPTLTLVNPKELPVPDPEYVSRMVSEDLQPLIAKTYKKDCRTWLWKSRLQRESCLMRQKTTTTTTTTTTTEQPKKDW